MKLLKRLTMIANRSPVAESCPSNTFDMFHFPAKAGFLFQERAGTFATIFGGRADAESSSLELQAGVQAGIEADIHGFHDQPDGDRSIRQHLATQARL